MECSKFVDRLWHREIHTVKCHAIREFVKPRRQSDIALVSELGANWLSASADSLHIAEARADRRARICSAAILEVESDRVTAE